MKTFLRYLGELKEYIIFTFLIMISLILVFQNDNVQVRFMRAAAVSIIGVVQSAFSVIPNVFQLEKENSILRETNTNLSNEVSQLKEAMLENMRLKHLLEFKESTGYRLTAANIVGKSLIQTRNNITLNVGEKDSVKIGMPIVTDKGLVGRIVATSRNYSIAQILLNKDLKIASKDQRSRVDGIVSWNGESKLVMKNVSKSADVVPGDVIITSDYSNNFPAGVPIGYVTDVTTEDNLFKKIELKEFVDFVTLEEVFVIKYLSSEERQNLEKKYLEKR